MARNAVALPNQQRLALARFLIELNSNDAVSDVEGAWEDEIKQRADAVMKGTAVGVPFKTALQRISKRLSK